MSLVFERDLFENPVRVQLNTTSSKQCTYLAFHRELGNVFVKGPFRTKGDASIQERVHAFKRLLLPNLPSIESTVLELLVDCEFLACQYGIRRGWDLKSGFFFVCSDLSELRPLPQKLASSKKWAIPVQVVDFDKMDIQHVWYNKDVKKSIFITAQPLAIQYVLHLLLSWVCGCGADLAGRNFVIKGKEMYAVDLEVWCKFDWNLADTPVSRQERGREQLIDFVRSNWDELSFQLKIMHTNIIESGAIFFAERKLQAKDLQVVMDRIKRLETVNGLIQIINTEKRESNKRIKRSSN